jgi:transposase-like protein
LRCDAEAALQISTLHRSDAENGTHNRQRPDAADDPFRQDKPMTIYRRSRAVFTPEALEDARRRYEETDETQVRIAADLGVDRGTLTRLARTHGWVLRKDRPPTDIPEADKIARQATEAVMNATPTDAPGADVAIAIDGSVADRLEAAVERELRKVENLRAGPGSPTERSVDHERVARTLATLTETLFKVRRLRQPGGSQATDDDDLPADADEFRVNLARRIEAFVHSRVDGSVSEGDQPADGEPAAS